MYNTSNSGKNRVRGDKRMKKQKFSELLKSKGFYLSLLTGILAILVISVVYYNVDLSKQKNNLTDLNKQSNELVANNTAKPANSAKPEKDDNNSAVKPAKPSNSSNIKNDARLENDVETKQEEKGIVTGDNKTKDQDKKSVTTQSNRVKNSLSFDQEAGLLWPVQGNVLMKYSMDKGTYFATLNQYKCNPAIIIDSKVGTKVKASATGIVTKIETDEETGKTVTMDIGDDFSVVYGQLKDVKVKKGDTVKEGSIIGTIAKPTKYYSIEGENLYYQVLEKGEPINPMLLLR